MRRLGRRQGESPARLGRGWAVPTPDGREVVVVALGREETGGCETGALPVFRSGFKPLLRHL